VPSCLGPKRAATRWNAGIRFCRRAVSCGVGITNCGQVAQQSSVYARGMSRCITRATGRDQLEATGEFKQGSACRNGILIGV